MKKIGFIITSVILSAILVSCGKPDGFVVKGKISNYYNNEIQITVNEKVIATSPVKKGEFELKGDKLDYPVMAYLTSPGGGPFMMFFLGNGEKLNIDVNYLYPDKGIVKGSKANHSYNEYKTELFKIQEELYDPATSQERKEKLYEYDKILKADLYKNNKDNILGIMSFMDMHSGNTSEFIEEEIATFSPELRNHPIFSQLQDAIKAHKNKFIGDKFIEINYRDAKGKTLPLSKVAGQGKYVLIDFWASWCGPCLDEIPYLKESYNLYKDKGFDIFGVSFDSDDKVWKDAIAKYELPWHNVFGLGGDGTQASEAYDVASIPANFLVDPNGVIIAKNLRGEQLKEKLGEVLGKTE